MFISTSTPSTVFSTAPAAPDVNLSEAYFSVSGNKILFGLDAIQNVGENAVEAIIKARKKGGPFTSMSDFLERVEGKGLNSRACESLIRCGAMDGFGYNRSQLLAALPQIMSDVAATKSDRESGQMSLFGGDEMKSSVVYPDLEDMDADEKIDWERKLLGFYVSGHPLEKYKKQMAACTPIYQLETEGSRYDGKTVTLGGTVTRVKGMVTKKGTPVILHLISSRQEIRMVPKFYVDFSEEAEEALKGLLGNAAVEGRKN